MWWMYIFIFAAKLVEVSLATIRNVLINRGEKLKGALIGFFEVMIWVIVVNQVLDGISEDPVKLIVYCLAFACGNYIGVIIEGKLAIGTAYVQAVVSPEKKDELSNILREKGFGVTIVQGEGKNGIVDVMMIYLKRKCVDEAISLIKECSPSSLVTVNDVRHLRNGYIRK
ncbi:DUF5698 domain-containing protein [Ruminococcaceae bacterium OttesenSCG-928-A16]|nr:DUF5698 domain-containing protein [Ruminococcaceae bacterium OttesenSCG-928-A16]